jgi:hypothetical protein
VNGVSFQVCTPSSHPAYGVRAKKIRTHLEENVGKAYFSRELVDLLKVKPSDIMSIARRLERQGHVLIRGYREGDRETPFKRGYLISWVDSSLGRDSGLRKAFEASSKRLEQEKDCNPFMQRIRVVRDCVVTAATQKQVVSREFLRDRLHCTAYELDTAIRRAMELYRDIAEVKLFDSYPHFYLVSIPDIDLAAALQLRQNYIRKTKGANNREGHNFESCVSWFIERTATGARFWTQQHRSAGMHARRITTHLVHPVGNRRLNAELDRVWEVSPGPLQPSIAYVLECKLSMVSKRAVDEFQKILQYSTDFGVDTPDGRAIRNGVVGVFAAGTFDPRERVRLKDGTVLTLSQYAARCNIQLIRTADLNEKLQQRGCDSTVTVQRICRVCRDETEVTATLQDAWENPETATKMLEKIAARNRSIFELERRLNEGAAIQSMPVTARLSCTGS